MMFPIGFRFRQVVIAWHLIVIRCEIPFNLTRKPHWRFRFRFGDVLNYFRAETGNKVEG